MPLDEDVLRYRAFIYKIVLPDGRYYVGRKNVYRTKDGKIVAESNWRDYWSSSRDVKAAVRAAGKEKCRREIIQLSESVGKAGYLEDRWLLEHDAMIDPLCVNGNIARKYQRKVVAGWYDDGRCERYMVDTAKQRRAAGLIE